MTRTRTTSMSPRRALSASEVEYLQSLRAAKSHLEILRERIRTALFAIPGPASREVTEFAYTETLLGIVDELLHLRDAVTKWQAAQCSHVPGCCPQAGEHEPGCALEVADAALAAIKVRE